MKYKSDISNIVKNSSNGNNFKNESNDILKEYVEVIKYYKCKEIIKKISKKMCT